VNKVYFAINKSLIKPHMNWWLALERPKEFTRGVQNLRLNKRQKELGKGSAKSD